MSVVGCFVVPHGCLVLTAQDLDYNSDQPAFDPSTSPAKCLRLQTALLGISEKISELNPDVILLSTPHSKIYSCYQNLFFSSPKASGSATWLSKWSEFQLTLSLNPSLSHTISTQLRKNYLHEDVDISILGDNEDVPLRWGEVVPLWFLEQGEKEFQYVLMAQAQKLLSEDPPLGRARLARLGEHLRECLDSCMEGLRVVVMVSGDLSHYHSKAQDSPYKYHPSGDVFDQHIARWVESLDGSELESAAEIAGEAGSCGIAGVIMLEGFLKKHAEKEKKDLREVWDSQLCAYEVPSYYGMMVASFLPKGS